MMDEYNLLADLLDTFQSSSDYIKTVMILMPPAFVLGFVHLLTRHRRRSFISADAEFIAVNPADASIEQTDRQPKLTHDQIEKSEF